MDYIATQRLTRIGLDFRKKKVKNKPILSPIGRNYFHFCQTFLFSTDRFCQSPCLYSKRDSKSHPGASIDPEQKNLGIAPLP